MYTLKSISPLKGKAPSSFISSSLQIDKNTVTRYTY
ncbi:hypothetical protein RO3G_08614 [Rhizopus delemar RA 99-880]|uniref:Uncharacterized protein n=1 Tax=Rhizopus delemar (strain RA 99-880 / ATCC MYA-4621 / FGSC 9543 / NRRL 43880) TaxID=246409 RepID=I1C629_RHIO9|nr:hypothetical protein RO3G_08614 [Rhizopus delemar RA 99-880]|eukprot:EIE83909.1 hypothetical protein RO3G_08614 [Rhizopus delemar RA 99-880]